MSQPFYEIMFLHHFNISVMEAMLLFNFDHVAHVFCFAECTQ